MPRLENWSVVFREVNPYQPPEALGQYLHGTVFDHAGFPDGDVVTTSRIVNVLPYAELVVTRSGVKYALGKVDPEYEKLYPNARQRLLNDANRR